MYSNGKIHCAFQIIDFFIFHLLVTPPIMTNHFGDSKCYCVWAYFCHKNCFQTSKKVFKPLGLRLKKMDFPIVGSKIKIFVDLSVTYQNLSGEK